MEERTGRARSAGTRSRRTTFSSRIRWACRLALSPDTVSLASVRRADWMLQQLRDGGFSPEVTYHAYHALDAHILGFTLWQLGHGIVDAEHLRELAAEFFSRFGPDEYPYLREHAEQHFAGFGSEGKGAYELVLDLILDGIEREQPRGLIRRAHPTVRTTLPVFWPVST